MDIYDFINLLNDCDNMVFTVFDCNKEELILVSTDESERYELNKDELLWSDLSDYEIGGTDMWYDNEQKCIHIEFNIYYEEED